MNPLNWVIGSGGLLGSAVLRRLRAGGEPVFEGPSISWGTPFAADELAAGLAQLAQTAGNGRWQIYWCAGTGVISSNSEALREEVLTFQKLLDAAALSATEVLQRGSIFLASSAGGVYGGSTGAPFDEFSATSALGDYGRAKLATEDALRAFSRSTGVLCLVGRISNLYGPGQSLAKPQGLVSHLCLSVLTRKPLSVFVSLDTLRDYFYVDDCADLAIASCQRLRDERSDTRFHIKVMASGRSVSIGALLSQFRQIIGRRPDIIMGSSSYATQQSRDLRLRSLYWTELDEHSTVNLADGIARTLQDLRNSFLLPRDLGSQKDNAYSG